MLVGHLVTRVRVWWTVVGRLWWRRGVDPVEKIEWLLTWVPEQAGGIGHVDGVDDVEPMLTELPDRFVLHGHVYRLEWCDGEDVEMIWAQYGW